MEKSAKIYVAGHGGMVGSAIVRELSRQGHSNIIVKTHSELDLANQQLVYDFFRLEMPEYVILAAAKVGGIGANIKYPADFLMENLLIQCNVIKAAHKYMVKKLLFLGSSCIYPKDAKQPISEDALLTGPLEPTNEGYALAKIAGLKLCEFYRRQYQSDFISVMPCNLYGYGDNFDANYSHIIPALIRKIHEAKIKKLSSVSIWGSGKARRELLFADDMAEACIYLMDNYSDLEFINLGYGEDFTVMEIASMIKNVVGYEGEIETDMSKPEGMFRKIVDSSKINSLGWKPRFYIEEGLELTYQWFLKNISI